MISNNWGGSFYAMWAFSYSRGSIEGLCGVHDARCQGGRVSLYTATLNYAQFKSELERSQPETSTDWMVLYTAGSRMGVRSGFGVFLYLIWVKGIGS